MHKLSTRLIFISELKLKFYPEIQGQNQAHKSYSQARDLSNINCE